MTINERIARISDDELADLAQLNDEYSEELARNCYSLREGWHAWSLLALRANRLSLSASTLEAWRQFAALPGMDRAWFRRIPYRRDA